MSAALAVPAAIAATDESRAREALAAAGVHQASCAQQVKVTEREFRRQLELTSQARARFLEACSNLSRAQRELDAVVESVAEVIP